MTWTRRGFLAASAALGVLTLPAPALGTVATTHPLLGDATLRDLLATHGTPRYAQFQVAVPTDGSLSAAVLAAAQAFHQLAAGPSALDSVVLQHNGGEAALANHLVLTLRYESGNTAVIIGRTTGDLSSSDVLRFAGGTLELARGGNAHRWITPGGAVSLAVRQMPAPPLRVAAPIQAAFARALA